MYKIFITRVSFSKKWYWKILAGNSKILATSETYSSRAKASKSATRLYKAFKDGYSSLVQSA